MIVAILALVIATAGTSYAYSTLNGKFIQKNSVPGNRLKKGGVTGTQVNENSLGTVPRAKSSNQLQVAGSPRSPRSSMSSASTMSSSDDPSLLKLTVGQERPLFSKGPLTVKARCYMSEYQGQDVLNAVVEADSAINGAWTSVGAIPPEQPLVFAGVNSNAGSQPEMWHQNAVSVVAPDGSALNIGASGIGLKMLGADCVFIMYAVG